MLQDARDLDLYDFLNWAYINRLDCGNNDISNHAEMANASLQTASSYGLFRYLLSNGARSKARGLAREGEPAMVLVRFEYLRSDSERKLLLG